MNKVTNPTNCKLYGTHTKEKMQRMTHTRTYTKEQRETIMNTKDGYEWGVTYEMPVLYLDKIQVDFLIYNIGPSLDDIMLVHLKYLSRWLGVLVVDAKYKTIKLSR